MSQLFRTGPIGGCPESQQTNEELLSLPEDCLNFVTKSSPHHRSFDGMCPFSTRESSSYRKLTSRSSHQWTGDAW
ncbi:MAG: hypothetical protein EZS28_006449 [Streblomastix strix]|uniref:Uncharacterized protein n=1 Tax=Streblomastix strix TaxID=222440 RepID=A0A5J4WSW2_9EUKA|nr:MAG: hypothetical protein EZS28_006449 [Streblomastix strix]